MGPELPEKVKGGLGGINSNVDFPPSHDGPQHADLVDLVRVDPEEVVGEDTRPEWVPGDS
jgi:hypothetical protein